jgi:hypothetical protein
VSYGSDCIHAGWGWEDAKTVILKFYYLLNLKNIVAEEFGKSTTFYTLSKKHANIG